MEEQTPQQCHGSKSGIKAQVESRSLFDCFGKKHKTEDDVVMIETVPEVIEKKEEKHTLMDELQRSRSNSSSSSDDEGEEGGEKKCKKKKGSEENFQRNVVRGNEENLVVDDGKNALEILIENENADMANAKEAEKKENSPGDGVKDKKGILEKMKEMIPGQLKSNEDKIKEKEN